MYNPTEEMLKERFDILNAVYLPDNIGRKLFYRGLSPVNTFRIIFTTYFGKNYNILEDRCYYSVYAQPYKFTDVTAIVNGIN